MQEERQKNREQNPNGILSNPNSNQNLFELDSKIDPMCQQFIDKLLDAEHKIYEEIEKPVDTVIREL